MELTYAEIYNAGEPLKELLKVEFPALISMELVKLMKVVREHWDSIEQVRAKLVKENGEPDKKRPGSFRITPEMEGFPKFAEEFGELLDQKVELEIKVVKLPSTIMVAPYILMALERFVELGAVEVIALSK